MKNYDSNVCDLVLPGFVLCKKIFIAAVKKMIWIFGQCMMGLWDTPCCIVNLGFAVICDVIKQNESELAVIDFQIEPILALNFLCILVF